MNVLYPIFHLTPYENSVFLLYRFLIFLIGWFVMAKSATVQLKLESTAGTGYFYTTKKNPRAKTEKLQLKKYDPKARKHVVFKETKMR